jgi:glyoxylase-like metal-dependent hydrolase (beta-lactamase superfamily II)
VLDWIDRRFAPPSVVAVNSHYHADAAGGNRVLRERGVAVWGSALTAELVRTKGAGLLEELRRDVAGTENEGLFDQSVPVEPDHLIPDGESRTLELGGQRVVIVDPGPAHSPDNVVVWFPHARILFGGCMVKASDSPGYLGEASLEHWPEARDRLRALEPVWVVPGHGRRFDPGILDLTEEVVRKAAADSGD